MPRLNALLVAAALFPAAGDAAPVVPTEAVGEAAMVATAAVECGIRSEGWADAVIAAATGNALRKALGDAVGQDGGAAGTAPETVTRVVGLGRFLARAEVRRDRQATCARVTRPGALDPFDAMARARALGAP